jgi:hypothetical protein
MQRRQAVIRLPQRPSCSARGSHRQRHRNKLEEIIMGRGILLWLLGVPIPIIILLALIWH